MVIRETAAGDLPELLRIFESARGYMRASGNGGQWGEHYPPVDLLEEDIDAGRSFVGVEDGIIRLTFVFAVGIDPTYLVITGGDWLNSEPYGYIHRVASDGTVGGAFGYCFDFCRERADNLRIDTHENNHAMRHALEKRGFVRCGEIITDNGTPRIAYQYAKRRGEK